MAASEEKPSKYHTRRSACPSSMPLRHPHTHLAPHPLIGYEDFGLGSDSDSSEEEEEVVQRQRPAIAASSASEEPPVRAAAAAEAAPAVAGAAGATATVAELGLE